MNKKPYKNSINGGVVVFKKIIIALIILFLILFLYLLYPKSITFEHTYNGIIYSTDNNFEKKTKIILEGTIYRYILQKDEFIGKIVVDDDISQNIKMKEHSNKFVGLFSTTDKEGYTRTLGSIQTSSDLSLIWLNLEEIDERYKSTCYVSGPANNKAEGNKIAENILKR